MSNLLAIVEGDAQEADAFFDGFLSRSIAPRPRLFRKMKPALISRARAPLSRKRYSGNLAGILTFVWVMERPHSRPQMTDSDLREVLIHGGDDIATDILWQLQQMNQSGVADAETVVHFFSSVWPLQKVLRVERVSSRLIEFMLNSDAEMFPHLLPLILPRLVPCNSIDCFSLSDNREGGLLDTNPDGILAILSTALVGDPARWPYRTENVLQRLAANSALAADPRLQLLRRRLGRRLRV